MAVADFQSLYEAWRQCRRRKRATPQAQRYEIGLLDNLMTTVQALDAGCWRPAPPVCFAISKPKAREIHAAPFADRVVHHWLVPRLEALYEPIFIHDVYSNRKGKGTHAAVHRLQGFMRSLGSSASSVVIESAAEQSRYGCCLQLDIKNFFNSIDRRILFNLIQQRLLKSVRSQRIGAIQARFIREVVHVILRQEIGITSIEVGDSALLQRIPAHKRLINAGQDKGLPIGNLTSQFFANVYLNELDQFIKHSLKCRHYLRYVDDFVLLHHDTRQLVEWQQRIASFLDDRLRLALRERAILKPCSCCVDFLGYIVKPRYRLVRRRVIGNLREKLHAFGRELVSESHGGRQVIILPAIKRQKLQSVLASYFGHFSHAHSQALIAAIFRQIPWLDVLFKLHGRRLLPRWEPVSVSGYRSQVAWFRRHYPIARIMVQRGTQVDVYSPDRQHTAASWRADETLRHSVEQIIVREQGYLHGGLKRRVLEKAFINPRQDFAASAAT